MTKMKNKCKDSFHKIQVPKMTLIPINKEIKINKKRRKNKSLNSNYKSKKRMK